MQFEVGETVVYPHHGAAKIIEVKKRKLGGEEKLFLKLQVNQGDLTIEVPAENCDLVGVRDVIDQLKRFRSSYHLDGISIRDMIEEGRR